MTRFAISTARITAASSKPLKTSAIGWSPKTNDSSTSSGATNSAIWALDPIAMLTARSILSLRATNTATQCSATLPTIATTIAPMKNSLRPIDSAAVADRADQDLAHHADQHARDRERDHAPADVQPHVVLVLVLGVEEVAVGPQREDEAGDVGEHQDDRDARLRCLDRRAEVTASAPDRGSPPPSTSWNTAGIDERRGGQQQHRRLALAAVRLKRLPLASQPADEHRRAQHQQDVADDRADDRRLHDLLKALEQREERDHQLGEVPEGTFSRPPIPGPERAASSSVARPSAPRCGMTPSAEAMKIERVARVRELEHDRDRDQRREQVGPALRR